MNGPLIRESVTTGTPEPNADAVLRFIVAPHVALVTINRESARNAVNANVALGLERAVRAIDADPDAL